MRTWPRYPSLFEINTWVWLSDLSVKCGRRLDLGSIPPAEWDALGARGFDAVWLMGVWERSPRGIAISNANQGLLEEFRRSLPDFRLADNVGSPYSVRRYVVDRHLGGPEGLVIARRELAKRGIRLIVDLVPNHVAPDHPWVAEHPDYFVRGTPEDVASSPASYGLLDGGAFAFGRDPYFPAWQDVLQLNAFHPGLRRSMIDTIEDIARQSDGVRCDMAMLLLNSVFERTWRGQVGATPPADYWAEIIPGVKKAHPGFLFIAEAYWDLEWELQQQGFDFCYDKRLYDRLENGNAESVRLHLSDNPAYHDKLLRFIENHDEPRAAAAFSPERERAAAIVAATVPGARLFNEGQLEGRKIKTPVFLGRRATEPVDNELLVFYLKLLGAISGPLLRDGRWSLCERTGWPDNASYQNVLAWNWVKDDERCLIAINLSDRGAQARIRVPWEGADSCDWRLYDAMSGAVYERAGDQMRNEGLYVELEPWGYHLLHCYQNRQDCAGKVA
ncbi:MAG: alpha-amylase family glycosyl hydrolase [Bryobacteraceae bacterium]